ncbi:MAG: hypothetical protein ACI4I9_03510 [Porcipelethomonas sp.]
MSIQTYFLGGVSPSGFRTKFLQQIKKPGYYTYILKGGPGTGKSTLMKKAAEALSEHRLSLYYCSSDTRSLDAVVDEDLKTIIVDGTSPHVFEAIYPGAAQEVINLGEYWDSKQLLSHADAIRYCTDENGKYHRRTRCFIEAAAAVNSDIYSISEDCINRKKLDNYTQRLLKKLIPHSKEKKNGKTEFRQLSAFTADGYMTMPVSGDFSVYFVKDDLLAGSDIFLRNLTDSFTAEGYSVRISEFNILHTPSFEHISVPELGLVFMTGSFFNRLDPGNSTVINFSRFYSKEKLSEKKQRISFDKKASLELASEASLSLRTALQIHDELEKHYISAIDFEKLSSMTEELIEKITAQ